MKRSTSAALTFGGGVAVASLLGSLFTPARGETKKWYRKLNQPPFNPPREVFPVVWTTLYSMMALAAYRLWKRRGDRALELWWAQLALNAAWSPIFFGAKKPTLAMVDLVALLGVLLAHMDRARKVDGKAAALMIPYLIWTIFAGAINAEIIRRNP